MSQCLALKPITARFILKQCPTCTTSLLKWLSPNSLASYSKSFQVLFCHQAKSRLCRGLQGTVTPSLTATLNSYSPAFVLSLFSLLEMPGSFLLCFSESLSSIQASLPPMPATITPYLCDSALLWILIIFNYATLTHMSWFFIKTKNKPLWCCKIEISKWSLTRKENQDPMNAIIKESACLRRTAYDNGEWQEQNFILKTLQQLITL